MLNRSSSPSHAPGSLAGALQAFVTATHLDDVLPAEQMAAALRELEAELLVVGAEAYRASCRDALLSDAARDFESYPALAKLHAAIEDTLTLGLPPALHDWACHLMSAGVPAGFEAMLRGLVSHARRDENPIRQALCRFLVFEGMRFLILLRTKLSPADSYGAGMADEDVDAIASSETAIWMDGEIAWTAEVESLETLAVAGLIRFEEYLADLRASVRTVSRDLRDALERRARLEARLFELDARDAILIRNELADEFEVQRLSVDLLRERHAAAFGDVERGALYTQLSRLRNGRTPRAKGRTEPALADLLRDHIDAERA